MREDRTYWLGLSYKNSFSNVAVLVWPKIVAIDALNDSVSNAVFMKFHVPSCGVTDFASYFGLAMSKGDTIHKIMSGLAASASLKMREMVLGVRWGRPSL